MFDNKYIYALIFLEANQLYGLACSELYGTAKALEALLMLCHSATAAVAAAIASS